MHDEKLKWTGAKVWDPYITYVMECKDGIIWVIFACLHELVWNISCTELLLYSHWFLRRKTAEIRWTALLKLLSEKESIVSVQFGFIDRRPLSRMSIMEIILTGDAEDILSHTAVNSIFRGFSHMQHIVFDSHCSHRWQACIHRDGHHLCVFFPSTAALVSFL